MLNADGPPAARLLELRAVRCPGPSGGVRRPALAASGRSLTPARRGRRQAGSRAAAATALAALVVLPGCGGSPPWNVLLVTFDTTRADHIGCYGNATIATPNLDRLAAEGVRFERAYSAVPMTLPSHTTILTGQYPLTHGVRDNGLFILPESRLTLAEILQERGYATAAAIAGFPLVARFGLDQGFDLYDDRLDPPSPSPLDPLARPRLFFEQRAAGRVNEAVLPWLRDQRRGRPFFLWVHYYDAHQPLEPPPPYDELYASDPYDGEIAYADESLGVLLGELGRLGLEERTLIVFTADHGEGLGEHGEATHSFLIYDATLHVPLIIRPPGGTGGRVVEERVASVDVMPTILDLLEIEIPTDLQGRSLAGCFDGPCLPPSRPVYAETLSPALSHNWGELRAWLVEGYKYIHGPRPELYDLAADPRELRNLVEREPGVAADLRAQLASFIAQAGAVAAEPAAPADEEVRQRLLALGYLAGDAGAMPVRDTLRDGGVAPRDRVGDLALVSQARQALSEGRGLAAREASRELLRADPANGFYRHLLALSEAQMGRLDEALRVLDATPADGADERGAAELRLQIGGHLYLQGRRSEGLRQVREAVGAEPTGRGLHLLASMLQQEGLAEEADEALARAVAVEPAYAPARVDLAIRHAQAGEERLAEDAFQQALRDDPYLPRGHFNYGAFLAETGRSEAALEHLRRAIDLDPRYDQARQLASSLLLDAGRVEEANALLEGAVGSAAENRPGSPMQPAEELP